MTAIRRAVGYWLPPNAIPVAVVGVVAVLLLPTGAWIAVVLLSQVGTYLIGRSVERAVADARVREQTQAMGEQLAHLERYVAECGEADHAAIRNPPRRTTDLVNPAYRSRRTTDSPVRSGAGLPLQAGVPVE